ncbi:MAG: aspartyl protease family protein [Cellulosilyticaceae bacterium]
MNYVKRKNVYGAYYVHVGIWDLTRGVNSVKTVVFDTGAVCTIFDRDTIEGMGYKIDYTKTEKLNTAGGCIDMNTTNIQGFKLGTYKSEKLSVGVADLSHLDVLGVLGMDFIDEFIWVIDTTNNCLAFEKQETLDSGNNDISKTLNLIIGRSEK